MSNSVFLSRERRTHEPVLRTMTMTEDQQLTILSDDDLKGMRDFIEDAEMIEGPDELYAIVAELWPDLLHKIKPPRVLMH